MKEQIQTFMVYFIIFLLGLVFIPYIYDKDAPLKNCNNLPDGTGGYNPVCDKPGYTSVYKKYIAK